MRRSEGETRVRSLHQSFYVMVFTGVFRDRECTSDDRTSKGYARERNPTRRVAAPDVPVELVAVVGVEDGDAEALDGFHDEAAVCPEPLDLVLRDEVVPDARQGLVEPEVPRPDHLVAPGEPGGHGGVVVSRRDPLALRSGRVSVALPCPDTALLAVRFLSFRLPI